ncbi:MAG: hypothetical protein CM15mP22_6940 [Gammaproteobacteria bacterium]|nr:MAG: hypothetical protein CM15mP22_6940 [Gammaproteobacteria bacterium]
MQVSRVRTINGKEITMLSEILNEINHPLLQLLGGKNFNQNKSNFNLANKASCIVVGGGLQIFFKAAWI